jgi:hypothetical protein
MLIAFYLGAAAQTSPFAAPVYRKPTAARVSSDAQSLPEQTRPPGFP